MSLKRQSSPNWNVPAATLYLPSINDTRNLTHAQLNLRKGLLHVESLKISTSRNHPVNDLASKSVNINYFLTKFKPRSALKAENSPVPILSMGLYALSGRLNLVSRWRKKILLLAPATPCILNEAVKTNVEIEKWDETLIIKQKYYSLSLSGEQTVEGNGTDMELDAICLFVFFSQKSPSTWLT